MVCKLCGKTKKEHFQRKAKDSNKTERFCTKYGKTKYVLENACEVCGVETSMGPDGQYICNDCRYDIDRRDAFKEGDKS